MYGSDLKTVCVAGKNHCAIKALEYLISKKKTCLIICHDNELLSSVDRYIYLQNGKIIKDKMIK